MKLKALFSGESKQSMEKGELTSSSVCTLTHWCTETHDLHTLGAMEDNVQVKHLQFGFPELFL